MTSTSPLSGATPARQAAVSPSFGRGPARIAWTLGGGELGVAMVGLAGLVLAALGAGPPVIAVLAVLVAVVVVLAARARLDDGPVGFGGVGRLLLLAAAVVAVLPTSPWRWLPLVLVAAVVAAEVVHVRLHEVALPFAAHLPALEVRGSQRVPSFAVCYVNAAALVAVLVLTASPAPVALALGVALAALAVTAVAVADLAARVRTRRRAERRVRRELTAYAPRFALHWDAVPGTSYQIERWIPYLDRIGERYVVFVRNASSFGEAAALTDHPVLLRRGSREMDPVMVDSIRCVFYVNNALRNVHVVRYPGVRHVQLNHGDSDKATSYNPVFRMFDRNFVAGQAAIDRFAAHGVATSPDFFEIVGRPQVEHVRVAGPDARIERVLYAPTWAGMHSDSAYSSLPIGPVIVRGLLERGCTVFFRPHPYTNRTPVLREAAEQVVALLADDHARTGRPHVYGPEAESARSITDCFNAVDALVSDVSSVVPDFLYSEKPFAIVAMAGSVDEFFAEMPVARGGYVLAADAGNLPSVLEDLLVADPNVEVRRKLKAYYLGDLPTEGYADVFLAAARAEMR